MIRSITYKGYRLLISELKPRSFFTRVTLILSLISAIGVFSGTFYYSRNSLNSLVEVEEKYTEQIINDYASQINSIVDQIRSLFTQIYINDFFGFSLYSLIKDENPDIIPDMERYQRINEKIQTINHNYPFTTDVALIDYISGDFYFYSKKPGRGLIRGYTYGSSSQLNDLYDSSNPINTILTHYPEYMAFQGGGINKYPVFSVCLNIYDLDRGLLREPLATLIININPDLFETMIDDTDEVFSSRIMVVFDETNEILFDSQRESSNINGKRSFNHSLIDQNLIFYESEIDSGLFKLISLLDRSEINKIYSDSRLLMIQIMIMTVIILFTASLLLSRYVIKRFKPLTELMGYVEQGDLDHKIEINRKDEIGEIERAFNEMCLKLNDHIHQVYLSKLRYRTAQLKIMQQQMNPHFMYNTLQSIQMNSLMNGDKETAEMVHLLGNIFRWVLDDSAGEVQIGEELLYLQTYITLQAMRFEGKIQLNMQIPADIKRYSIAKLSLQPIVENAIQHGFRDKDGGSISISAELDREYIVITLSNDGNPMVHEEIGRILYMLHSEQDGMANLINKDDDHIGLWNVHSRLNMFYSEKQKYNRRIGITSLSNAVNGGVEVQITIPSKH